MNENKTDSIRSTFSLSTFPVCPVCGKEFSKFVEKKSYAMCREKSEDKDHFHYGTPFFIYGVCDKFHFSKHKLAKVLWDPCVRCHLKGHTHTLPSFPSFPSAHGEKITRKEFEKVRDELDSLKKTLEEFIFAKSKNPEGIDKFKK